MVQLQEVEDEELHATQPGPKEDEDEWDTDDGTRKRIIAPTLPLTYPFRIRNGVYDTHIEKFQHFSSYDLFHVGYKRLYI